MKKIFAYVGSRATKSITELYVNEIIGRVKEKSDQDILVEIFTPSKVEIKNCIGCRNCFDKGECILDKSDDMQLIKNKMLEADFIILATPVYANNVSGDMKVFIDRISYWMHLFRLAGKPGIAVTTTSNSGAIQVLDYLYKIMTHLGICVVDRFNVTMIGTLDKESEEIFLKDLDEISTSIKDYINNKIPVKADENIEKIFRTFKQIIKGYESINSSEYKYWQENKYFQYDTFDDLLKNII